MNDCDIIPKILSKNGEWVDSKLFTDLLSITKDRQKAKEIYTKVHSDDFINWFGDWINDPENASKVVDENGEPMVVYHSTSPEAEKEILKEGFSTSRPNGDVGVYFSGDTGENRGNIGSVDVAGFLNAKNPIIGDVTEEFEKYHEGKGLTTISREDLRRLSSEGYDSAIIEDAYLPSLSEYIVFDPNQIKSVFNKGDFSSDNDNIYFQPEIREIETSSSKRVDSLIKVSQVLQEISDIRKTVRLNSKDKPNIEKNLRKELQGRGVGNDQINLIFQYMRSKGLKEISTDQLALDVAQEFSYSVEIETAIKRGDLEYRGQELDWIIQYDNGKYWYENKNTSVRSPLYDTEEEAENWLKSRNIPTNYYANLTVPGGTNYTENEIRTPDITSSIKGHAQFSTDQGIGWFRSDEQVNNAVTAADEGVDDYMEDDYGQRINPLNVVRDGELTNTRRILEIQSDLFQKGRDREDLIKRSIPKQEKLLKQIKDTKNKEFPIQLDFNVPLVNNYGISLFRFINAYVNNPASSDYIVNKIKDGTYKNADGEWLYYNVPDNVNDYQPEFPEDVGPEPITTVNEVYKKLGLDIPKLKEEQERALLNAELDQANKYENNLLLVRELEDELNSLSDEFDKIEKSFDNQNQFLQLLNKDNNWVTFFIKSIIQDSAKKGYEKVLFPKGDTAAKIEGHQTLEEFKRSKETRIKELEEEVNNIKKEGYYKSDNEFLLFEYKKEGDNWYKYQEGDKIDKPLQLEDFYKSSLDEIKTLKQELADVESGQTQLSSIAKFYEETVTNILKKQGYSPETITDEYGNKWSEITIKQKRDLETIYFQPEVEEEYRFQPLINKRKEQLYRLQKSRQRAKDKKDDKKVISIDNEIEKIEEEIEKLSDAKERINNLSDLVNHWNTDKDWITEILQEETPYKSDILNALDLVKFWKDVKSQFLDEDEMFDPAAKGLVRDISSEASDIEDDLNAIVYDNIVEYVDTYAPGTAEEFINMLDTKNKRGVFKDENWGNSRTRSLHAADLPLLKAIGKHIKSESIRAAQEKEKIHKQIDKLHDKMSGRLKKDNLGFEEVFHQVDENGEPTGQGVFRFSQKFFNEFRKVRHKAFKTKSKSGLKEFFAFKENNMLTFDPRKHFPDKLDEDSNIPEDYLYTRVTYAKENADAELDLLRKHLGDKGLDMYLELSEKLIERFREKREAAWSNIQNSNLTEEEKDQEFDKWVRENSPYVYMDMHNSPAQRDRKSKGYVYVKEVPKKFDEDNNLTGFYDPKYERIENTPEYYDYYEFFISKMKELNRYLPKDVRDTLQINQIPFIEKDLAEKFSESGMQGGIHGVYDAFVKNITGKEGFIDYGTDKELSTAFATRGQDLVSKELDKLKAEYDGTLTNEVINELRSKAQSTIAKQKTPDLTKVFKLYTDMLLSYRHKSRTEDMLKIADTFLNRSMEVRKKGGKWVESPDGSRKEVEGGLKNARDLLTHTIESMYRGTEKSTEGTREKIVLTTEEKKEKKRIEDILVKLENDFKEGKIKEDVYNSQKEKWEKEIESLGSNVTLSDTADTFMRGYHVLKLGWNFTSAINNLGFGLISNLSTAADGRSFTMKDYLWSMKLAMYSVTKNLSLNTIQAKEAKKLRSLMDKNDILKDASTELGRRQNNFTKMLRRLLPYQLTKHTEYLNQAPIFAAMMRKIKIDDEHTLWDAYDENGEWKLEEDKDWNGDSNNPNENKKLIDFITHVERVIARTHGDYDTDMAKLMNKFTVGRALKMFRTWMFEGFASRWEKEDYDEALGYVVKGRWRSYKAKHLTLLPLLNDFRKAWKGELSEVDSANMRANMVELIVLTSLISAIAMLKAMFDDDERERYYVNSMINTAGRLQDDVWFYINPYSFEKIMRHPIPVTTSIIDLYGAGASLVNYVTGEDEIKTGPFAGESRLERNTTKLIPLWSRIQSFSDLNKREF